MGDGSDICSDVVAVLVCCGEVGAKSEGEALNLPVDLRSHHHLWSWALGNDQQNKTANTDDGNGFL